MARRRYLSSSTSTAAQKRIMEDTREAFGNRAALRIRIMYPPPLTNMQLLQVHYTREELQAMHLLIQRGLEQLIERGSSIRLSLTMPEGDPLHINIPWGGRRMMPDIVGRNGDHNSINVREVGNEACRTLLVNWMEALHAEQQVMQQVRRRLKAIHAHCGSLRQAIRVWPDVQQLFLLVPAYAEYRREATDPKARSPIPDKFLMHNGEESMLVPEWHPEALEKFTPMITSLHMLPDVKPQEFGPAYGW